jgi:transcriptional regulator with XRE-family HTH domain
MDKSVHSPEYQCFLQALRRAREAAGLTQFEVAELLGEPQSWVSRVETGETRMHVIELRAYCRAIGLEPARFVAEFEIELARLPR